MTAPLTWEDFAAGESLELGERTLSHEEIVDFARRWDPQPVHVDPAAGANTPLGGLVASGLHPAVIWSRMYVDAVLNQAESMGGPGMEEVRQLRPVRPGQRLRGRLRILETWPSTKRADRGTIRFEGTLRDDDDEVVMRLRGRAYFGRREAPGG